MSYSHCLQSSPYESRFIIADVSVVLIADAMFSDVGTAPGNIARRCAYLALRRPIVFWKSEL